MGFSQYESVNTDKLNYDTYKNYYDSLGMCVKNSFVNYINQHALHEVDKFNTDCLDDLYIFSQNTEILPNGKVKYIAENDYYRFYDPDTGIFNADKVCTSPLFLWALMGGGIGEAPAAEPPSTQIIDEMVECLAKIMPRIFVCESTVFAMHSDSDHAEECYDEAKEEYSEYCQSSEYQSKIPQEYTSAIFTGRYAGSSSAQKKYDSTPSSQPTESPEYDYSQAPETKKSNSKSTIWIIIGIILGIGLLDLVCSLLYGLFAK